MEEKIKARLAELRKAKAQAVQELQRYADTVLAPFNAAISELEALLPPAEGETEDENNDGGPVEVGHES